MHRSLSTLAVALASLLGPDARAQPRPIDLDVVARDGARLRATYYSPGKPGPAILLLHQCNMDRRSWTALGAALAANGIHALAIDYRGYGESPRVRARGNLAADVDDALATLTWQRGVDRDRLAAAGASCGVNNAVQLARRSGRIRALVLVSGPTTATGLAYLRARPTVAIFAAASSSEQSAISSLREMAAASRHRATMVRVIGRPGHGVPLFDADSTLLPAVVDWLTKVLR